MNQYMSDVAMSNKFPGKLWRMVNTCTSGAIGWSQAGHTIIIHQARFQLEYLDPPNCVFKTSNIGSFIRQLNLYGFRKLNALRFTDSLESEDTESRGVHEFQNDYFIQGRPDLLNRLRRNVGIRRSRELAVKRRMEIFQALPKKICDSRCLQYVESGGQPTRGAFRAVCPQKETLNSDGMPGSPAPPSSVSAAATNPQPGDLPEIPVFLQWDGQSYKYVILPDHNLQLNSQHSSLPPLQRMVPQTPQSQAPKQQNHLLMPRYDALPSGDMDKAFAGSNLHIVQIPSEDGNDSQQYYLINVKANSQDEAEEIFENPTKQSEYIDMYDMARSLASSSNSTPSMDRSPKMSFPMLSGIQVVDDETLPGRACDPMELLDSSSSVLNRDASLPSVCPSASLELESPSMSQSTSPADGGMFPYDMLDKSELDVYIRGHDEPLLAAADRDELALFPGVTMSGGGDGMMDGTGLYQDRDMGGMAMDQPVIVESIESQYRNHSFVF